MAGKRPERAQWFELAEAASVGIEMAVAVSIGHFGGLWLEKNVTHWAPQTRWIGLAVGLGAAILAVVRTAMVFQKKLAQEEAAEAAEVAAAAEAAAEAAKGGASAKAEQLLGGRGGRPARSGLSSPALGTPPKIVVGPGSAAFRRAQEEQRLLGESAQDDHLGGDRGDNA